MHNQGAVENENFLGICCAPYKSMCCATLKTGVEILGVIDVISGFFYTIALVFMILGIIQLEEIDSIFALIILRFAISTIGIPFAIIGLIEINSEKIKGISLYSNYKIIEYFLITCMDILIMIYDRSVRPNPGPFIGNRIITLFLIKVIWSAKIRLMYNQTVLVKYGEEAHMRAQQQSIDLANVNVILPGMPINYMVRSSNMSA